MWEREIETERSAETSYDLLSLGSFAHPWSNHLWPEKNDLRYKQGNWGCRKLFSKMDLPGEGRVTQLLQFPFTFIPLDDIFIMHDVSVIPDSLYLRN